MRRAELTMAVVLGLFSLYLMYLSQLPPLQIGWVAKKGPGSGAFPFWLSLVMLICCVAIFWRGWKGKTPQSASSEPFMDRETVKMVSISVGAIFLMLLGTHFIGAYASILLFLLFYIRFVGKHGWVATLLISILSPIALFFFFEGAMKIIFPKGITEPLFYPLYALIF